MNRTGLALFFYLVVLVGAASAITTAGTPVAVFTGDATTYNPFIKGGYKTGGGQTATGPRYNPDAWEAALQLDLATKYQCGRGAGKTCYAAVQAPNGRAMIVLINDNGPMCADSGVRCSHRFERIIDLNEKSMRYLGNDSAGMMYGNNKGLIKNVKVALLSGNQHKLGPIDEKDRDAWAKKILSGPSGDLNPNDFPPPQKYYQNPLGGWETSPLSKLYNQPPPPPMQLPPMQPASTQLGQYFENPSNKQPQTIPVSPTSSPPTSGKEPKSIADELLDLVKPDEKKTGEKTKSITVGDSLYNTKTLDPSGSTTKVELVPVGTKEIYPPVPQTFVSPALVNATPVGSPFTQATMTEVFEALRQSLERILEILRVL